MASYTNCYIFYENGRSMEKVYRNELLKEFTKGNTDFIRGSVIEEPKMCINRLLLKLVKLQIHEDI